MIPIFKAEIDAGIAEKIRANASIAYVNSIEPLALTGDQLHKICASLEASHIDKKIIASISDSDLYPTKSILATTCWNKNDDVFDPHETWYARHSVAHKPSNFEHDELVIIGHMIDSLAIDTDGVAIADNTAEEDLPDLFHLLDMSVVYRSWSNQERKKKVEDLIAKIKAKEAFVSMECIFRGFDYGVVTSEGSAHIVARDKDSAFLTKHLRAYGGTGEYEGHKIGRVMRRMTFSGKGFVTRPANPDSAAFPWESSINFANASQINPFSRKVGVLLSCTDNSVAKSDASSENKEILEMTVDTNKVLEDQIAELKAQVKTLVEENKTLASTTTKASIDKLEEKVSDLTKKLDTATADHAKVADELKAKAAFADDLQAKFEADTKVKADLEAELSKIKAESTKTSRISTLVAGGITKEEAEATVEKFAALSDDQFKAISEFAIKAAKTAAEFPPKKDDKKKKDAKKGDDGAGASEAEEASASTDLDDVEEGEELALSSSADESEEADASEKTRAGLVEFFASRGIGAASKNETVKN